VIDFSATDDQRAFADAVRSAVARQPDAGKPDASARTWRVLADLGALTLLTKDSGGDLRDLVELMAALGAASCPGAIVMTVAAAPHLSPEEQARLATGDLRVSTAIGDQVPWRTTADVVLEIDGEDAWRVTADPIGPESDGLSGDPWTPTTLTRIEPLPDGVRFLVAAELGLAATLIGAAQPLLDRAADHARTRVQFGKPIGSFQGVAHPLAESWARLTSAAELARLVATEATRGGAVLSRARLVRAAASDAALHTAYAVHQAMGGLSFANETGIGGASTRIRQWSLLLPDTVR
jgi:alkylation response protein AidB-like acyl-CoA dehydrogenase